MTSDPATLEQSGPATGSGLVVHIADTDTLSVLDLEDQLVARVTPASVFCDRPEDLYRVYWALTDFWNAVVPDHATRASAVLAAVEIDYTEEAVTVQTPVGVSSAVPAERRVTGPADPQHRFVVAASLWAAWRAEHPVETPSTITLVPEPVDPPPHDAGQFRRFAMLALIVVAAVVAAAAVYASQSA